MPRFRDIPQLTQDSSYGVDVGWEEIERHLGRWSDPTGGMAPVDLDPDFQRNHVWTEAQQIAFIEFKLRGGRGSHELRFNYPGWRTDFRGDFVLVDGKQRLEAVRRFMRNEIPAFGHRFAEYTDRPRFPNAALRFMVNTLPTRADVLNWYLEINAGGVAHTPEEIARVRALLDAEHRQADH